MEIPSLMRQEVSSRTTVREYLAIVREDNLIRMCVSPHFYHFTPVFGK